MKPTSALVLGCAESVWDELAEASALHKFDTVIPCNGMIALYPGRITYACSVHREDDVVVG